MNACAKVIKNVSIKSSRPGTLRTVRSEEVVMAFAPLLQVVTLCSSGLGKLLMKRDHYFNNHNHYLPHAIHPGRPSPVSVVLSLL
jgi:hypothetical protein